MRVVVCDDDGDVICRTSYLPYWLRCLFDRRLNVTTSGVNVTVKESYLFEKKGETNVSAQMLFYTSDLYDTLAPSPLQVSNHSKK